MSKSLHSPAPEDDGAHAIADQVNDVDYLDREAALAVLGIKKESLYTYVSRGLIRTISEPGKRTHLYRKSDIEKLKTRAAAKSGGQRIAPSLRYGEPVVQTWVCEITDAGPRYRGHLATTLARDGHTLEYAADLIWGGMPPMRDLPWGEADQEDMSCASMLVKQCRAPFSAPEAMAHIAVALASKDRMESGDARHSEARSVGMRLLNAFAGVCGRFGPRRAYQPRGQNEFIAERLLKGFGLDKNKSRDSLLKTVNAALVLSVDNELSTPTFCARISASTGADLYSCVAAALMAQSGPMQMGGSSHLEAYLQTMLENPGRKGRSELNIPCFNHPLYTKDPRAELILEHLAGLDETSPVRATLLKFVQRTYQDTSQYPNLFAALVILSMSLGLPAGSAAFLHTLSRSAGWIAHAAEQRLSGTMLRPRARYMGNAS
ncbi:MAG: citrate/2-methylcitrate synthase [Candidimonas sp.]|jgi:citrate synthase